MSTLLQMLGPDQERRARDREHVQRVVDAIVAAEPSVVFGEREGPCVVEYRDWWQRGWPMRRAFSCVGCRWHERNAEFRFSLCAHPKFLEKYGCHQSIAHNHWWRQELAEVHAFSCPVLRDLGVADHCPPPPRDEIPGREPSKAYRRFYSDEEAAIFQIPQRVPHYVQAAYDAGEKIESQTPSFCP